MKQLFTSIFFLCSITIITAQNSGVQWGYNVGLEYSLYHWNKRPPLLGVNNSTGQILNLVPGINTGLWVGQPKSWILSLNGEAVYSPFALDINGYSGLGTLSLPVHLGIDLPIAKTKGLAWVLGAEAGTQWTYLDLYARPDGFGNSAKVDFTYTGGVSGGLLVGWDSNSGPLWLFKTYIRAGGHPNGARTIHWGLRLHYYGRFAKPKTITTY